MHSITDKITCEPGEDLDQPGHIPSQASPSSRNDQTIFLWLLTERISEGFDIETDQS